MMSSNGGKTREDMSLTGQILGLVEDHAELASLEWRYEKAALRKALVFRGIAAILFLTAYALLQVALVRWLIMASKVSPAWVYAGVGFIYTIIGMILFFRFGKRDPAVDEPFQGTRQELRKNLQWIQRHFS
jgi:uncharacterized membrane protein YqjE